MNIQKFKSDLLASWKESAYNEFLIYQINHILDHKLTQSLHVSLVITTLIRRAKQRRTCLTKPHWTCSSVCTLLQRVALSDRSYALSRFHADLNFKKGNLYNIFCVTGTELQTVICITKVTLLPEMLLCEIFSSDNSSREMATSRSKRKVCYS